MTVQKLLDRLAHVADKTKPVMVSGDYSVLNIAGLDDRKETFFIDVKEDEANG